MRIARPWPSAALVLPVAVVIGTLQQTAPEVVEVADVGSMSVTGQIDDDEPPIELIVTGQPDIATLPTGPAPVQIGPGVGGGAPVPSGPGVSGPGSPGLDLGLDDLLEIASTPPRQQVTDARSGRLDGAGCTAFAIGPTVLLTAAHCVYNASTGTIAPGALRYYPSNGPDGLAISSVKVSPQWIEDPGLVGTVLTNTGADWAVLTLESGTVPFYAVQLAQPAFGERVTSLGATDVPGNGYLLSPPSVPGNYEVLEGLAGLPPQSSFATGMKIEPGFSGGPVLSPSGAVIGLNSSFNNVTGVAQHTRITCELARFATGASC